MMGVTEPVKSNLRFVYKRTFIRFLSGEREKQQAHRYRNNLSLILGDECGFGELFRMSNPLLRGDPWP